MLSSSGFSSIPVSFPRELQDMTRLGFTPVFLLPCPKDFP